MADYKSLFDTDLIDLLEASDHAAFSEIYQRYYGLLFIHAFKKLKDEDQAKDVLQEVFAKLWLKKGLNGAATNLAGYLYTSVRNRIFDLFAHQKVQSKYIDSLKSHLIINQSLPADAKIKEKELSDCIEREIQALPPKMRRVFEMSRKEDLTYREIAKQLNTSEGNVSKQINNSIRILRMKLSVFLTLFV